jgi:hypothetical protein
MNSIKLFHDLKIMIEVNALIILKKLILLPLEFLALIYNMSVMFIIV